MFKYWLAFEQYLELRRYLGITGQILKKGELLLNNALFYRSHLICMYKYNIKIVKLLSTFKERCVRISNFIRIYKILFNHTGGLSLRLIILTDKYNERLH